MSSRVTSEVISLYTDPRGWVVEPVDEKILATQRNVHMVLSQPGAIRGNHFHKNSTEELVVIGPSLVRVSEDGVVRDVSVPEGQAMRFSIPPGVPHAVQNTGTQPAVLVSFATQPLDRANPDTFPAVLINKS